MANVIPFKEGTYIIEHAYLVTERGSAVSLENAYIEVYRDPQGRRLLRGQGFVRTVLMVAALEEDLDFDLIMDLGKGFRYRLPRPRIQAGKVFEPETRSIVHFAPNDGMEAMSDEEYSSFRKAIQVVR